MYLQVNGEKVFCSNGTGTVKADQQSVIFLHGAGMDHSIWVLPSRYFARNNFNVFALDFPGHGRSTGKPCGTIEAMAEWVNETMEVLEISTSAIVGHSMGSLVGLDFAARYPEKTRSLALLGTSTPMPVSEQLLDAAEKNHHDAIEMTNTWSHSKTGTIGGNEIPGISMTMSGQRLLEQADDDVLFSDLNACNNFRDGLELAENVTAPTMVILGLQDRMTLPLNARKVAAVFSDCRLVELDLCGHAMLAEQPNAVLDALTVIV